MVQNYNFKYVQEGMKFLGIWSRRDLEEIQLLNLNPLSHKIKINLDKTEKLKLILWGKISILKMTVAPQFNYILMMLPIPIPPNILNTYEGMVK